MRFLRTIGQIGTAIGGAADELLTSDEERLAAQIELRKLDLEEQRIEDRQYERQTDINLQEAKHSSVWVAGWRPGVGWVALSGLGVLVVLWPVSTVIARFVGHDLGENPIDPEIILALLSALLGVGGLRTYEKFKGVAREKI